MNEVLESLSELVKSLIRLQNSGAANLLNCDIKRLEKAQEVLMKYYDIPESQIPKQQEEVK